MIKYKKTELFLLNKFFYFFFPNFFDLSLLLFSSYDIENFNDANQFRSIHFIFICVFINNI